MKIEKIEYSHRETYLEAVMAYEESPKKRPTIIIFHAWAGRDAFVIEKAQWLSSLGYVGCAVDMYGKGVLGKTPEENAQLMDPFMQDRQYLRERMFAAIEMLKKHPMVDAQNLGAIGFCFGGLCALDLARSGAHLKGVVSFHGLLNAPEHLESREILAKILVLHGHDDPMVSLEQVESFQKEMTQAKADWQMHIYGDTLHSFTNPTANNAQMGVLYSSKAERRALEAMENFFQEVYHA